MHNSGTKWGSSRLQFDWIQFTFLPSFSTLECLPKRKVYFLKISILKESGVFCQRDRLHKFGLRLTKTQSEQGCRENDKPDLCTILAILRCRPKHWFLQCLENLFNELHFGSVLQRDVRHVTLKDSRLSLLVSPLFVWTHGPKMWHKHSSIYYVSVN